MRAHKKVGMLLCHKTTQCQSLEDQTIQEIVTDVIVKLMRLIQGNYLS